MLMFIYQLGGLVNSMVSCERSNDCVGLCNNNFIMIKVNCDLFNQQLNIE